MNKITIPILFIVFLSACMNDASEQQNEIPASSIEEGKNCYRFNNGKDSIQMSIEINDNIAKGRLNFNYDEKDANIGTFSGTLKGDTLWANYTFISEGIESKREIVFLKQENNWIQGYGDVTEKDGGFVFINHTDIWFDNTFILEKVDCKP